MSMVEVMFKPSEEKSSANFCFNDASNLTLMNDVLIVYTLLYSSITMHNLAFFLRNANQ
jgi:hypothetical protein